MNFIIQQSRSFEGVCVPLRLMSCLFPVPDSQPTVTELYQSPPFGYGTVFRSTSRLLHSLENILLRTVLFIILLSCLRSDIVILDTLIVLLTYLLTPENSRCFDSKSIKVLSPGPFFLAQICSKLFSGWGFAPDPTGELSLTELSQSPKPPSW